jgi:hypothetical protein
LGRYTRKALQWLGRNRQPHSRLNTVGQLAGELLDRRALSAARRLGELQEVVAGGTDGEFCRHCSLGPLQAGNLTILVDDPSRARAMRDEWLVRLLALLKGHRRRFGVSSIRFTTGSGGLSLETAAGPDQTEEHSEQVS